MSRKKGVKVKCCHLTSAVDFSITLTLKVTFYVKSATLKWQRVTPNKKPASRRFVFYRAYFQLSVLDLIFLDFICFGTKILDMVISARRYGWCGCADF